MQDLETKPKPYRQGPMPGGELPEIGKLINETLAEFTENLAPYAMAGLGQLLVIMPVTFLAIILLYAVMAGGMFGTWAIGAVIAGILGQISEDLASIAGGFTALASMIVPFLLLIPLILAMAAVFAPIQGSLYRAVAAQQRGEKMMEISAAFSTATQGVINMIIATCIVAAIACVALMFCYLPVLLVPVFFGFTTSLAALHNVGGFAAARMSMSHAISHISWYALFGVVTIGISMVASYVPVLGPMFLVAMHVRAYRQIFGDGTEPVTT